MWFFYVIDYVPVRFSNRWLNNLYHAIDRFCVRQADMTWNLAEPMVKAREQSGLESRYRSKQIAVPVGTEILFNYRPATKATNKSKNLELVYLGILSEEQGVGTLLKALTALKKHQKLPSFTVRIIGSGPLEAELKEQAESLGLSDQVMFSGYVAKDEDVNRMLTAASIGLAPYAIKPLSFKQFTDPGKIKTYLGAGLPIIMTDISPIAAVIKEKGAGLVIDDDPAALQQAIETFLTDPAQLARCRRQAQQLAQSYQWNTIFNQAFDQIQL